jgi:hypothetical protein
MRPGADANLVRWCRRCGCRCSRRWRGYHRSRGPTGTRAARLANTCSHVRCVHETRTRTHAHTSTKHARTHTHRRSTASDSMPSKPYPHTSHTTAYRGRPLRGWGWTIRTALGRRRPIPAGTARVRRVGSDVRRLGPAVPAVPRRRTSLVVLSPGPPVAARVAALLRPAWRVRTAEAATRTRVGRTVGVLGRLFRAPGVTPCLRTRGQHP